MRFNRFLLTICAVLALATASFADSTYNDLASWNAATGGTSTYIGFGGIASPGSFTDVHNGLTISGTTFTDPNAAYLIVVDPGFDPRYAQLNSPGTLLGNGGDQGGAGINVALPTGINAVAFDELAFYGGQVTITFSDGTQVNIGGSNATFLGFSSDRDIASVLITSPGDYPLIGNFREGTTTPEPGSLVLLGTGLVGLAGSLRRKFGR